MDFYATRLLGTRGNFSKFFSKKSIFSKKVSVFFQKKIVLNFFFKNVFFFQIKAFSKKNVLLTKKFYFDQKVNIFEAFHLTLVKRQTKMFILPQKCNFEQLVYVINK